MKTISVMLKFYDENEKAQLVKAKVHEPNERRGQMLAVVEVDDPKHLKDIQDAFLITATPDYPVTVVKGDVEVEVGLELEFEEMYVNKSNFRKLLSA